VADVRRSRRRGPRAPVALLALAAAALLALVAVGAARGPLGSGAGRPAFPSDLVASLLLLLLVAAVATLVLAVIVLAPDRQLLPPRRQRNGIIAALLPLALLLAVWLFREPLRQLGERMRGGAPVSTLPVLEAPEPSVTPAPPGPLPLLVAGLAVVAMAAIVAAALLADRRRRVPPRTPAERLVELLDDTLDDIEWDPDPRRAVIAAWARMERGLAAAGLPRAPAEAPFEYVARVLAAAEVRPASVHRLTDLFERAKFSRHTIDDAMRQEAVAALRAVRADLMRAAHHQDPGIPDGDQAGPRSDARPSSADAARAGEDADTAPAGR
jgi:hypothetical protein